jgi:hypothetical protein
MNAGLPQSENAGTPTTVVPAATSLLTAAAAPTVPESPLLTPYRTIARRASHTSRQMSAGVEHTVSSPKGRPHLERSAVGGGPGNGLVDFEVAYADDSG